MSTWRAALLLLAAAHTAQAADPVGRIFFTPEQRVQLDNMRIQKTVTSQAREEPVPEVVTYNGIVRRSDGKATVWINEEAVTEAGLRGKQSMVGRISRDGRITLQAPQSAVELKVGQSATLFSGKVEEAFTARPAQADKTKPADAEAPKTAEIKGVPPEVIEALQRAAAREAAAKPLPDDNAKPDPRQ